MENIFKAVAKWQADANLASRPHDCRLEASFQVEEALEVVSVKKNLQLYNENGEVVFSTGPTPMGLYNNEGEKVFFLDEEMSAKDISRMLIYNLFEEKSVSEVDKLDAIIDSIVYSIGAMCKLGLTPQQMVKAITIVNNANKQKLNEGQDELGKQNKPKEFVGPEEELKKLLSEVKK